MNVAQLAVTLGTCDTLYQTRYSYVLHTPAAVSGKGGGLLISEGNRARDLMKSRLRDPRRSEAPCEPVLACGMLGKVDEDYEDSSGPCGDSLRI